jgi:hypothetical protein
MTEPFGFDKDGNKITESEMLILASDPDYRRIAKTSIPHIDGNEDISISTVWLPILGGINQRPLFETMIFGGPEDGWMKQSTDEAEASANHKLAVHLCTGLRAQDRLVK